MDLSLAREALRLARAQHSAAQATHVAHRKVWSRDALARAEARLAAAERGAAEAALRADRLRLPARV